MRNVGLALTVGALLALPTFSAAQNADVTVSATVNTVKTITTEAATLNLSSGANPGATVSVAPNAAGAGRAKASFNASATVSFSQVTAPTNGTSTLTLTYTCSYDTSQTAANYSAAAGATSNDSGNFGGTNCGTPKSFNVTNSALDRYLFVGASVTVPSTAIAGTYSGTVRFTIS